jgi:anti-sigma-K factor RskA
LFNITKNKSLEEKMKCKKIQKLLPGYLEGVLSADELKILENHIHTCDACRREYQIFEETIQLASSLEVEYPPPDVWEAFIPMLHVRIMREKEKESYRKTFFLRFSRLKLVRVAFAALILVFSALVGYQMLTHTGQHKVVASPEAIVAQLLIDDAQAVQLEQLDTVIPSIEISTENDHIIQDADLIEETKPKGDEKINALLNNLIINVEIMEVTDVNKSADDEFLDAIVSLGY